MTRMFLGLFCMLFLASLNAQEDKAKVNDKNTAKKTVTFLTLPQSKPTNSNLIGPGNFNPDFPNFYTYWDNKFWPMEVTNIQYIPRSNLTVPTNNKRMSIEVTGKTKIPGQDLIHTGPPVYETSDLKFYETLFHKSKDYIIIFNFNGQGHMMYYHKSLIPDYFK